MKIMLYTDALIGFVSDTCVFPSEQEHYVSTLQDAYRSWAKKRAIVCEDKKGYIISIGGSPVSFSRRLLEVFPQLQRRRTAIGTKIKGIGLK